MNDTILCNRLLFDRLLYSQSCRSDGAELGFDAVESGVEKSLPGLWHDKVYVMDAVKEDGCELKYASHYLGNDKEESWLR